MSETSLKRPGDLEARIARVLESLITFFFAVILIFTILLVILRYVFNSSIIFGNELIEYLFVYTTSFGAAVSLSRGEHIKIDFFKDLLKQPFRMVLDVLGQLLIGAINVVILISSINWIRVVGNAESPVMRLPMWIIQICIPLGCGFVSLFALMNMIRIITSFSGERKGGDL